MHIEKLGSKTYLLPLCLSDIDIQEDGSGILNLVQGSTDTQMSFPASIVEEISEIPAMAVIDGEAELAIWITPSCAIAGVERVKVASLQWSDVSLAQPGVVEVIPF